MEKENLFFNYYGLGVNLYIILVGILLIINYMVYLGIREVGKCSF